MLSPSVQVSSHIPSHEELPYGSALFCYTRPRHVYIPGERSIYSSLRYQAPDKVDRKFLASRISYQPGCHVLSPVSVSARLQASTGYVPRSLLFRTCNLPIAVAEAPSWRARPSLRIGCQADSCLKRILRRTRPQANDPSAILANLVPGTAVLAVYGLVASRQAQGQ